MRFLARVAAFFLAVKAFRAGRGAGAARPSRRAGPGIRGGGSVERGPAARRAGEPGPDTPLELRSDDWKATAKRTLTEIRDDRVTLVAAGMAYYFFLAIFPAVIALVGVLGLVEAPSSLIDDIKSSIGSLLPGESGNLLTGAIDDAAAASEGTSLVAAVVGIALALWSSSSGFVHLQAGLNIAYDVPRDRKFFAKRGVAALLLIATGLLGGVPSPFFTFGEGDVFAAIGWVLTIVAVIVLFSIYYFVAPKRDAPTWHWVSPGGLLGAFLWIAASVAFKIYVGNSESYGETYGSIAAVVVLILWLFITSMTILIGGELNAELERQARRRAAGVTAH